MPVLRPLALAATAFMAILATLLACQGATPTSSPTEATVRSTVAATPALMTNIPEPAGTGATSAPTSKPETHPTPASISTPTNSPTPQATAAPTPFIELAKTPRAEPVPRAITPIFVELPKSVKTEVPDSELGCMAGTADAERLSRILTATEESTPEEMTHIMDCLQDETLLRMFLGAFVEYSSPGPLSPKTSGCIRASFAGIDPRSVMLAALEGNHQDGMTIPAVILTIACLNEQEWNAATKALDIHPDVRETMLCILKEMGGPEEMVAALGIAGQTAPWSWLQRNGSAEWRWRTGQAPVRQLRSRSLRPRPRRQRPPRRRRQLPCRLQPPCPRQPLRLLPRRLRRPQRRPRPPRH